MSPSPKLDCRNGFTDTAHLTPTGTTEPYVLSNKPAVTPPAELPGLMRGKAVEEKEKETDTEGVCLQNLLKKSREFIEKEQGIQGSKVTGTKIPFDKENGTSLDGTVSGYIPSPNKTSPNNLISPESGLNGSLRPHRGRPRPISAGNIFFSLPDNPNQPNSTASARPQEVKTIGTQERKLLGVEHASMGRYDDHSRLNETVGRLETSPVDPELTSPLFRRRCHTLDSHLSSGHQSPLIDRSQERMPRFMAGVTARTHTRLSPPSPMSKTFTRDSPTAAFMGSGISPDSPSHAKVSFEGNSVISTALKERRAGKNRTNECTIENQELKWVLQLDIIEHFKFLKEHRVL